MRLITRYVLVRLTVATLYTLIALLSLYTFFDIIDQSQLVGTHHYTLRTLFICIGLLLPSHTYDLMPLAVLIGGTIAMTQLAIYSEYTAMRTSGVTLRYILSILVGFGLICAFFTLLLGEFVAPQTQQWAQRIKLNATKTMVAQTFRSGMWVKDNEHFINLREILPDNGLAGINIYTYDKQYRLILVRSAEYGEFIRSQRRWRLINVKETAFLPDQVRTQHYPTLMWQSVVEPHLLNIVLLVPEKMSALNLIEYIQHLKKNKQKTTRYKIALWGKVFYPLACVSMAFIVLAFIPHGRQNAQIGMRLFGGICVGVGFHFINRFFSYLGLLHEWPPLLTALFPTVLFLLGGGWFIVRQEKQ